MAVLPVVTRHSSIDGFIGCSPIRDRVELRWLTRASGSAPVDHVAVVAAIGVQRQGMVRKKAPALSVGRHPAKDAFRLRRKREDVAGSSGASDHSPMDRQDVATRLRSLLSSGITTPLAISVATGSPENEIAPVPTDRAARELELLLKHYELAISLVNATTAKRRFTAGDVSVY